jgi:hypothetical protein
MQGSDYFNFLHINLMREPWRMTAMASFSAFAKILETISLVLPLKGVFILMNPAILPKMLTERGIGVNEVMIFISCAVVVSFVLARLLQVLAHNLAHKATLGDDSELSDVRTKLTVRLSSSLLALLLFLIAIALLYYPAALLIIGLIGVTFVFPACIIESHAFKFLQFGLGARSREAQYRLLGSCLFLVFFIAIVAMTLKGMLTVEVSLLITVLIARRLLQEYARLRIAILALDHLLKSGASKQETSDDV